MHVLSGQRTARPIQAGGLVPFSSADYPGQLAAVIFIQGCPWRCGYCHNPHLQARNTGHTQCWGQLIELLKKRIGLLDAVVFSGGEPTLDPGLYTAIQEVKTLGYKIGLHTAGIYPRRLQAILPLLDWVGLDIKTSFTRYDTLTKGKHSHRGPQDCLRLLQHSQIAYECRTTLHPALHTPEQIWELALSLQAFEVKRFVLQRFRTEGCADSYLNHTHIPPSSFPDAELCQALSGLFQHFELRTA